MKTRARAIIALLALGSCSRIAPAAVPRTILFQGKLANAAGEPVPDGPQMVTFRLYDALTGGNLLWSETKTVTVLSGGFATALGDTTAFPASLLFDEPYWV